MIHSCVLGDRDTDYYILSNFELSMLIDDHVELCVYSYSVISLDAVKFPVSLFHTISLLFLSCAAEKSLTAELLSFELHDSDV